MARILIIDNDGAFREGLAETLQDLGHAVSESADGQRGIELIRAGGVDTVFLDYRMPAMDGLEILRALRQEAAAGLPPVVMLTAFATSASTIEAMKLGAFDHLTKPIGRADVEAVLARALRQNVAPALQASEAYNQETLIGNSQAMREVQKLIGMAATSDTTVLITGETGTGKEIVARALHENSPRKGKPLVAVNCAAIPAELLESELFGHVRGAFSGAVNDCPGRFREAREGTLLLDEIGDMSLAMQAKILRALQDHEIRPVGAARSEKVDVRVVAATHRSLTDRVREGLFREDLLYRLNVIPIHVPALRERLADIVALAEHFLRMATPAAPKLLSAGAARRLLEYPWPGNVRELKNVMERCSVLVRWPIIEASDLADLPDLTASSANVPAEWLRGDLPSALARLEQAMIRQALVESGGNRTEAARRLGIHRQLLYAKIKEHGIEG